MRCKGIPKERSRPAATRSSPSRACPISSLPRSARCFPHHVAALSRPRDRMPDVVKKKGRGAKAAGRPRVKEGAGARALAPERPVESGPRTEAGGRGQYVYWLMQATESVRVGPL